ncbi:16S rRNA processing protein RimM [Acidisoma cellulosilytica]|uniref:Ribosome maturation factor RimM n=1 Tax=Acidisoma cellulosilyticum TaxID=2802395 RepID=A0A964E2X5_9PROT|nr:ribosome maturation factor RimM [Acidisoma cellulosilyticum]MCB8879258.1 16S rRNA processing protein RimM [Acidisoma cellulosilyticum]
MSEERILMGVIGRPHGVRGLVHVQSYTADPDDLADYGVLSDDRGQQFKLAWEREGVARLFQSVNGRDVPVSDREAAAALTNTRLYVSRSALPPADQDEYYLTDLIGLKAEDLSGRVLGTVTFVHDYGAGTSVEIASAQGSMPLIIPFTARAVPVVDVPGGRILVDPPEATDGEEQNGGGQGKAAPGQDAGGPDA